MSNVMETPLANGSPLEPMSTTGPQQGFDILKVLWRWRWLPMLGSIVGMALGYLFFTKQPAEYKALALVQVIESGPASSRAVQPLDANEVVSYSRTDESLVIKSEKVLRMAVEPGGLTEEPGLSGMSVEQIVAHLMTSEDLVVQPAGKDAKTTLLEISYICNDAEQAAKVVSAIVDGYSKYLSEEYRTVGKEITELVTQAQVRLEEKFLELVQRNADFRQKSSNVIWSGTDATDPYYEIYTNVKAELAALQVERKKLYATLTHVDQGIAAGRPPEQLLMMLSPNDESDLFGVAPGGRRPVPRVEPLAVELRNDTESARLERVQLFALQMREQELLDTVGEGHPSVASARKRIDLMREQIARLAASEKQEETELQRLRKVADDALAEQGSPSSITVEQRLAVRVNALKEKHASLEIQERELQSLADDNLEESKKLQDFMNENRLLNEELRMVQKLLDPYTEKVNAIDLLPPAGQRTLKELNTPSIGGFYGPTLPPYLLGGAAAGFMLLSGLAVLMDFADRSYRSPEEIAADLGTTVLGHIPIIETLKIKKVLNSVDSSVTTVHHSRGRASEAFRAVRTGLFFSSRVNDLKLIQITSPVPGDGKSTLSSNLAVTMAQSGRRVLLIDADFRRPRIAKIFGIDSLVGMAQVVADRADIDEATFASGVANLSIMPGGKRPSNPAELLSSSRFHELLEMLRDKFDMVIVDTPPLLAVSEPSAVASMVDGVVLAMRLRRNVKPLATRAIQILASVDARLLGVVVNGVSGEAGYGYSYGYNDYRYAYRYGGNQGYEHKHSFGGKYGSYSAGYIEDHQDASEFGEFEQPEA